MKVRLFCKLLHGIESYIGGLYRVLGGYSGVYNRAQGFR